MLDAGTHYAAGRRLLLGFDHVLRLSTCITRLKAHLPPIDTVDITLKSEDMCYRHFVHLV